MRELSKKPDIINRLVRAIGERLFLLPPPSLSFLALICCGNTSCGQGLQPCLLLNATTRHQTKLTKPSHAIDPVAAPNIFGFELVKRGVLAMLFGGTNKEFQQRARGKFRGEVGALFACSALCLQPSL